jgi:hypothetical protein
LPGHGRQFATSPPQFRARRGKGLSALAWVEIGCGGLLLATFVILITAVVFFSYKAVEYARKVEENPAKAAAELFVKVNPDVELVSADDQAGNATGNYVKVVQRVPVKLVFNEKPDAGLPLGPGESVVPTVKVQDFHYSLLTLAVVLAIVTGLALLILFAPVRKARKAS